MVPVVATTLLLTAAFALVILLLAGGFRRLVKSGRPVGMPRADPGKEVRRKGTGPAVTVVVPFRNEEVHLPELIRDLAGQSFPGEQFEVVLVNDHSTDRSKELAETFVRDRSTFRLLELPEGIHGKKAALAYGISNANGSRILQVDADCRLRPGFLAARMEHHARCPSDLSAGFVTTGKCGRGFTGVFERLDVLSLAAAGAGSFALGRPIMCSGANLLYSRELYGETRMFDPRGRVSSGDDMFLMIGARKLGRSVAFCTHPETVVETAPTGSFPALVRQRIRWAAKSTYYRMPGIQAVALLVAFTHLAMLLLPLWLVLFPWVWPWLAGAGLLKTTADFYLLWLATGFTSRRRDLLCFIPVTLLYYPFQLLVMAGALVRMPSWKGRRLISTPAGAPAIQC